MAWVRIEDIVPEHRKHLAAGPAACWLWVCGIAYCQRQLSDGFIPDGALAMLGVSQGVKALAGKLVDVGLFERVPGGYQVHDYLAFNASRDEATQRRGGLSAVRAAAGRNGGLRSGVTRKQTTKQIAKQNGSKVEPALLEANEAPSHPIPSHPKKEQIHARVSVSAPMNGTSDPDLGERAGRFLERYSDLYQQHRRGARYLPRPALDFPKACELCAVWPDERLDMIATVFLKTDNEFAQSGSRTIGQLAALASWCDDRLREVEAAS